MDLLTFIIHLSWYENIYYKWLASINGGEKELIESEFSQALDKEVTVQDLDTKTNQAKLYVPDIVVLNCSISGY